MNNNMVPAGNANALQKTENPEVIKMLNADSFKKQLAVAAPKFFDVNRLARIMTTMVRTNSNLLACTPNSILGAAMDCATLGLSPEPALGQVYVIPYKNNATLMPGYKGYLNLLRRSGEVKTVSAQVVYQNDHFELEYGLDEKLRHIPTDGDRGEIKGAYVIFRYKDGGYTFDYMSKADIDKIRKRSKSPNNGPWVSDYAEMAKKTVIRRHIKTAPLSSDYLETISKIDKIDNDTFDIEKDQQAQPSVRNPITVTPYPDETPEYPPEIRKQAASALGLPEYPEEPEEVAALKKKMEELSTAAGSSSAPA